MKELGYGDGYKYAHDFDGNFTREEFLPEEIRKTVIYDPQENLREKEIRARLQTLWKDKYNY
jgi:putative ATPase